MREMTAEGYIHNPGGSGSAATANRQLVKTDYTQRFFKLINDKKDLFMGNVYKDGQDYFIHIVIPSESDGKQNTYDVVIKFIDAAKKTSGSIKDCNIQVFSNAQSFIYTYAYVYDKEKLLVDELRDKFNDETFQPPETRNPYETISYEKTLFMSILYILNNPELMDVSIYKNAKSKMQLQSVVRHMDKIKLEQGKERARLGDIVKSSKIATAKQSKLKESSSTKKTTAKRGVNRVVATKGTKTKPKKKVTGSTKSRKITPTMNTRK